jgi:hypothetical protein
MMERFELDEKLEQLLDDIRTKKVALEFGNEDQIRAMKYAQRKSDAVDEVRAQAHEDGRDEDDAAAELIGDVYTVNMDIESTTTITVEVRALNQKHAEEQACERFDNGEYDSDFDWDGWAGDMSIGHVYARKKVKKQA